MQIFIRICFILKIVNRFQTFCEEQFIFYRDVILLETFHKPQHISYYKFSLMSPKKVNDADIETTVVSCVFLANLFCTKKITENIC